MEQQVVSQRVSRGKSGKFHLQINFLACFQDWHAVLSIFIHFAASWRYSSLTKSCFCAHLKRGSLEFPAWWVAIDCRSGFISPMLLTDPWKWLQTCPHVEEHPRTCKWLGSPPFISHETAIWKGSHNPILKGRTRSPWLLTTYSHSANGPWKKKFELYFP